MMVKDDLHDETQKMTMKKKKKHVGTAAVVENVKDGHHVYLHLEFGVKLPCHVLKLDVQRLMIYEVESVEDACLM